MIKEINKIDKIEAYPSQANYIMVNLKDKSSYEFCVEALDKYNILLKDLSSKNYFNGKNFIRVAVKDTKENNAFLRAIKNILVDKERV